MCAGQLPTALVEQLQQVPTNQENQQNEQDDIEIDQQNKNNIADQTFAVAELWRAALEKGKQKDAQCCRDDDNDLPELATFMLLQAIFVDRGFHALSPCSCQQQKQ